MALGPAQKALVIAGFLLTGSINTLISKWQFQTCGPTSYPASSLERGDCRQGWKKYQKPWTQNIQMFFGETLVGLLYLARAPQRAREAAQGATQRAPLYIFLLPACCDIFGTGVSGVGMLYITAPVWQMMRGSLIIFTSLMSVTFLKRKLHMFNWVAVLVAAVGLALVGVSAILDDDEGSSSSNVPLGIALTILSQLFTAFQVVVEERFLKGRGAVPEQVVGSEGVWGVLLMCVILLVMGFVPGNDAGAYENAADSLHMLAGNSALLALIAVYIGSIAFFNFFGVTISGQLSAVHRTINDATRTVIIWAVELAVFYWISEKYGTAWKPHSYLQLIGFVFLIFGNLVNHAIVRLPCLSYPSPEAPDECASAPVAVGLIEEREKQDMGTA